MESFQLFDAFPYVSTSVMLIVSSIILVLSYWYLTIPKNLPPGPLGLPVVGYVPFIGEFPADDFAKLAAKYGPIFSMYLGSRLVVVLNTLDVIQEAYLNQSDKFSGRPYDFPVACGIKGYIFNDNARWKHHRNLANKFLKEYGMGRIDIEPKIMNEVLNLVSELEELEGKPSSITEPFSISMANIISNIIIGKSHSYKDAEFLKLIKLYDEKFTYIGNTASWNYFPWLKKIPGFSNLLGYERLKKLEMHLLDNMQKHINDNKKTYQPGNKDNFINAYLTEMNTRKKVGEGEEVFNETYLAMTLDVLFEGGSETTRSWLLWSFLYMMYYPDIQKKIHDEIDAQIGRERLPQYADRLRTPYVEAALLEVGRINTIVPFNLSRENSQEAVINGYTIPEKSLIISNLWLLHTDASLWSDPQEFIPERFLSKSGEIEKPDHYIPFSIGKLNCFGEVMGKTELYLFFTTIMQKFSFQFPKGCVVNKRGIPGVVYVPQPFQTIITRRR